MAVFSTNQVRQLYVAKAKKDTAAAVTAVGDLAVIKDAGGKHIFLQYKGAGGNLMRSDLIPINNITYAKAINGSAMAHTMKKVKVTLASVALNNGKPISGQDYLLRIVINPYIGMSDEEPYMKYGVVHIYNGDTASDFYKKMAISLANNFSRELDPMLKFSVVAEDTETEVKAGTKASSLTGTYDGLIIEEIDLEWRRGVKSETFVNFDTIPTTITVDGDEVVWGEVGMVASAVTINNGRKIADLEYFCMGERGDQYRQIGWPHNIDTEYLVEPFTTGGVPNTYHVLEIHYAFTDEGIGVQRSEKDITIVCSNKAELNKIVAAFNTATGLSVTSLT